MTRTLQESGPTNPTGTIPKEPSMTRTLTDLLLTRAWCQLCDPGGVSEDVAAATVLLLRDRSWVARKLEADPTQLEGLSPARLSALAQALPFGGALSASPALAATVLADLRAQHLSGSTGADHERLLPIRRAHALVELCACFDNLVERLPTDVLVWLYRRDEQAGSSLVGALEQWCLRHNPVPPEIVSVVRELRAEAARSPTVGRLAAWVSPSVEGMLDLAGWESGCRWSKAELHDATAVLDSGWSSPGEDSDVLARNQENTDCDSLLRLAMARHGAGVVHALHLAREQSSSPAVRVVLDGWLATLGGVS